MTVTRRVRQAAALSAAVSTLQTGDVLLMRIDDALGRYIQFALDSPWNHAAVVVKVRYIRYIVTLLHPLHRGTTPPLLSRCVTSVTSLHRYIRYIVEPRRRCRQGALV